MIPKPVLREDKIKLLQALQSGKISLEQYTKSIRPALQLSRVKMLEKINGSYKDELGNINEYYLYFINGASVDQTTFELEAANQAPEDIATFE
jgi:hypothetical protein